MPPESVFLRSSFASPSGRVSSSGSSVHPPPPLAVASPSGHRESVRPSRVHPPHPPAVVRPSGSSPCSGRSPPSTRKRQSVVCRYPNGRLVLYCKGADNVIYERLAGTNQDIKRLTREHLEQFGSSGLRTLCLAYRDLTIDTYENWNEKFVQAKSSLRDREKKLDEVAEMIEKDLILIGCTAIEDKLQEGVPDCIDTLSRAGIKIWVLTGDKMETAINIAYACNLINNDMKQLIITSETDAIREVVEKGDPVEIARVIRDSVSHDLKRCLEEAQ